MMADTYKPYVSGITNYIDLNKRILESEGHEVYVFTFGDLDYRDDEPRVVRNPGVALADTGYVLDQGREEISGPGDELMTDPRVRALYLGLANT